jgi:hypothetical protein
MLNRIFSETTIGENFSVSNPFFLIKITAFGMGIHAAEYFLFVISTEVWEEDSIIQHKHFSDNEKKFKWLFR